MDEQIRNLIVRIESTKLADADKEAIYTMIASALQSTVWPILLKYMPKDRLEDLANNPTKVTIEVYGKLIDDTIQDGQALQEIEALMQSIVKEVDAALTEEGIAPTPATQ